MKNLKKTPMEMKIQGCLGKYKKTIRHLPEEKQKKYILKREKTLRAEAWSKHFTDTERALGGGPFSNLRGGW